MRVLKGGHCPENAGGASQDRHLTDCGEKGTTVQPTKSLLQLFKSYLIFLNTQTTLYVSVCQSWLLMEFICEARAGFCWTAEIIFIN